MKAPLLRQFCFLILPLFMISGLRGEPFSDLQVKELDALLREKFQDGNTGMVVALVDESGRRVFHGGAFGDGSGRQVDENTVFEIGSVTKVFTVLLLLDLARSGEVSLSDPVSRYLPEGTSVPSLNGRHITLENLAAQDSGLPWHPDNLPGFDESQDVSLLEKKRSFDAYTAEHLYQFLAGAKWKVEPGTAYQYSNVGMSLLGHALERRMGADYESLVVERICRPLEMESTRITISPAMKSRMAVGHYLDGAPAENLKLQVLAPAGSLLSTAGDLMNFLSAHLGYRESGLRPLLDQMVIPRHHGADRFGRTALPYVDEESYQPPDSELVGHGGGGFGYLAFIGMDLKKRRGVVGLSNQMAFSPSSVGWTLLQGMPLTPDNLAFRVRSLVGIGIAVSKDEATGEVRITKVFPQSPCGKAGVTKGQIVQKIDGVSQRDETLRKSLSRMGGQEGTPIELEILDPANGEVKVVRMTRERFITASG